MNPSISSNTIDSEMDKQQKWESVWKKDFFLKNSNLLIECKMY